MTDCFECSLALVRKRVVAPRGGFARKILLVGEAPGDQEEKEGRAFVGRSGQLLDKWLESIGLSENDVLITNVVKCRPPFNRDPDNFELESCVPLLAREIRELRPWLIVALGRFARDKLVQLVCTDPTIYEHYPGGELVLMDIKHPAWYLRKGGWPTEELDKIKELNEGKEIRDEKRTEHE